MNTASVVSARVYAVIEDAFAVGQGELRPGMDLRDELGADSMAIVEVVVRLEQKLGVEMPATDAYMAEIRTVGDLVNVFARAYA